MNRPAKNEYNPYFQRYIDIVPEGMFLEILADNTSTTLAFFKSIPPDKQEYRYAPEKWTCKDIMMHVIDTERLLSYRALVAMRGDATTPLPPVDENLFAKNVDVAQRSLDNLLEEFYHVRLSTQDLFRYITEDQSSFQANGVSHPITARALAYIMIGHVLHHVEIIKQRYL